VSLNGYTDAKKKYITFFFSSCYVAQTDLELLGSRDLPASVSRVPGPQHVPLVPGFDNFLKAVL
jgi:hypothetical protein